QLWDAMVASLKAKDVLRFVAVGGVMAHYVGDASQPLHCSFMHHGMPPMLKVDGRHYPVRRDSDAFDEFKHSAPAKIHGIYEETMLEIDAATALADVDDHIMNLGQFTGSIQSGHDAATAVIKLMWEAQQRLSPQKIIDADDPDLSAKKRAEALWKNDAIRKPTITSLAQSVQVLAALWTAAWKAGNGNALPSSQIVQFSEDDLQDVYRDRKFVPALSLDQMVRSRKFEP
ncbi:MAG: hypothetical protein JWO95_838, partial [Verrucomicrobiales bacterium]|nr:hypothetical protein [Verrucomicrobiales bacterium]